MILNNNQIKNCVGMITPFIPTKQRVRFVNGVSTPSISFGCSSFGYDIRLGHTFLSLKPNLKTIDPKSMSEDKYDVSRASDGDIYVLKSYTSVLACSLESFSIPNNVLGLCVGKSTYARCNLLVNVTPLEPGWEGTLTIELTNLSDKDLILYPGEGIAQIIFFTGDSAPAYAGSYQNQTGVTLAKVGVVPGRRIET